VTGNSRKPPNEELCDWGSSDNIIRIIESWSTQWVGHVVHNQTKPKKYGQHQNYGYIFGQTNLKNNDILVDLLVDGVV